MCRMLLCPGWHSGVLSALLAGALGCATAPAQLAILGVQYRTDRPFPEYECFWNDGGYPNSCGVSSPMGGSAHVFLKNNGVANTTIYDVEVSGISLRWALSLIDQGRAERPASVYLANSAGLITSEQLNTLLNAGEPVWYKCTPTTIPPGGTAQVVVRLRQTTAAPSINLNVIHSAGSNAVAVVVQTNQPVLAGVSCSADLGRVYLYWRHVQPGQGPAQILLDGADVTANVTTSADPALNLAVSVLQLSQPLSNGSFHVFQGVFADGQMASAGLRAWDNDFIFGIWGALPGDENDTNLARAFLQDIAAHSVNTIVHSLGSEALQTYLKSDEGKQLAASLGLGFIIDTPNKWGVANPRLYFIRDEPDSQVDVLVTGVASNRKVGTTGQWCLDQANSTFDAGAPTATLNTLTIDNGYKPYNFNNYGQLPDVVQVTSYYQIRLRRAYWDGPVRIPLYAKATYVYAMARATQSACEPNPLHMVLYACSWVESNRAFPFPTPESKRIETYYALAAGAKGLSYWWFVPGKPSNGIGAGTPDALALWREIGLLGAEVRTVGPLLATSCPATLSTQSSPGLWVRSLLAGPDAVMLLVVSDNYTNTDTACVYTPISNATLTVTLPAWLQDDGAAGEELMALQIGAEGILPETAQLNANQLQMNLGTLQLSRMIVLSRNAHLLSMLQQRYDQQLRPNGCSFAPAMCTNIPVGIARHPSNQTVVSGDGTTFSVVAFGTGLSYQWQTNNVNLTDDAHYSGCTNAVLTIRNCANDDATSYRCVIMGIVGTTNSSYASLTLTTNPPAAPTAKAATSIAGGSFTANWSSSIAASGFRLDVSTNSSFTTFVTGYQDLDAGGALSWNITGLSMGKTYYYRVRAYNLYGTSGNSGTINVTTAVGPPAPPIATAATSVTSSSFVANWNSVFAATGYRLDVSTNSSFGNYATGYQNLDAGNVLSWSVNGLMVGRTYYYRVRAYNPYGTSANSGTICVTTVPAAPIANPATGVISSAFTANWSSVAGAIGYQLDVSTNDGFGNFLGGYQDLDVGNETSRNVIELKPGAPYYYRLRAYNPAGAGPNSGTITVTLPLTTSNACVVILNPDFEGGFSLAGGGYIANNWNEWEGDPGVTTGYDETVIVHGGGHSQRVRVGGTNATSGGIYQRIPAIAGQPYSVSVWTCAGDNSTACSLGVDPAGGTNANGEVTWTSVNTNMAWVRKTWAGVATANYITVFCKVSSPDNVKRNGYFDDASPMPGPPQLDVETGGDALILSWPDCPNARLERVDTMTPPIIWVAATNQVFTVGGQKSVNVIPQSTAGFYRLLLE